MWRFFLGRLSTFLYPGKNIFLKGIGYTGHQYATDEHVKESYKRASYEAASRALLVASGFFLFIGLMIDPRVPEWMMIMVVIMFVLFIQAAAEL